MRHSEAIEEFTRATRRLLDLERQAEIDETLRLGAELDGPELERRGLCLRRLLQVDESYGLGGRLLARLAPAGGALLPATRIGPGDLVSIQSGSRDSGSRGSGSRGASGPSRDAPPTGVVTRVEPDAVTVALDPGADDLPSGAIRIDRLPSEVTHRRLLDVLDQLPRYRGGPADSLLRIRFGDSEPRFAAARSGVGPSPLAGGDLDRSQARAVELFLSAEDVTLIHGPPGTGKTTTLVECIRQAGLRGERILACAGTNVAVDNLVEKLAAAHLRVVRIGHPARLLPSVLEHSLEALVARADSARVTNDIRRELDRAHRRLHRSRDRQERRSRRAELRDLVRELRHAERRAVQEVIRGADVVLSTAVGAAESSLAGEDFDLVVLDEASQTIEPASWIPLLKARRALLAGDHRQLPPTIVSPKAEKGGLGYTLFERLLDPASSRRLTIQYRMHERIMEWSSREFYDGELEAAPAVRSHRLVDLPGVAETPETTAAAMLIDTAGCDLEEEEEAAGTSRENAGEAEVVVAHIERLVEAGVPSGDLAVISPYLAQVRRLRRAVHPHWPDIEVDTVDGFQGREKEAVVISAVRSNSRGEVGFLADERRMNVAITRARRHVALVADSATIGVHEFLGRLIEHLQERGEYRSAWEYR